MNIQNYKVGGSVLKHNFTDYELNTHVIDKVIVLVDTRENENSHIIDYFQKKNIEYQIQKLDFGDYTLLLKKNPDYGIYHDMILDYAIERKGSLEELSGNFTNDRARIEQELWRGNGKMSFVIENSTIDNILSHKYNTKYNEKSFIATLCTFQHRYGINYTFTNKSNSGAIIFALLLYKLREELK